MGNGENGENESWGDSMGTKSNNIIRIGFQNIGPQSTMKNDLNSKLTSQHITNNFYDIFMFAEHGLNLSKIKPENSWRERMGKPKNHSNLAYNSNEATMGDGRIYGGTGITTLNEITHRRESSGQDPTGLGRWTWTRLRGKYNQFTRISVPTVL